MEIDLDTARDLWAVRYGHEWLCYSLSADNAMPTEPAWLEILTKLRNNACFDLDLTAGTIRLKKWK